MSDQMTTMLEDGNKCETIARCWPIIKEILVEQQLITVATESDSGDKILKGHATAYRSLEQFQIKGRKSIDAEEAKKK
jgi:hypothetical protein